MLDNGKSESSSSKAQSPIIALANGTPTIYVCQPSDTIKGHMYYDLKLDNWSIDIEQTTGRQIVPTYQL